MRRHLGVVFDICHQSVQFEDIAAVAAGCLRAAGVPIFKLQAAAALWVPEVTADAVAALEAFTDTIYLSQTTERRDGDLTRYLNLSDAIDGMESRSRRERASGAPTSTFRCSWTTSASSAPPGRASKRHSRVHAETPLSDHLEIETYTWDVLPDHLKTGDITDYVARELEWMQEATFRSRQACGHPV